MSVFGLTVSYQVGGKPDANAIKRAVFAFESMAVKFERFLELSAPNVFDALEAEVGGQFEKQGRGPDFGRWVALSPRYAKWKKRHYPGRKILQREGNMLSGLTERNSPLALREVQSGAIHYGTKGVPYASNHQTGTATMPPRPPIDMELGRGGRVGRELARVLTETAREAVRESRIEEFAKASGFEAPL